MNNAAPAETTHNVNNSVNCAYMRQKLVSQPLSLRRAFNKPCYIHKFEHCGSHLFGVIHFSQHVETRVRHRNHAHIRLYCAKRIVRALRARFRNSVEKRALSYVR